MSTSLVVSMAFPLLCGLIAVALSRVLRPWSAGIRIAASLRGLVTTLTAAIAVLYGLSLLTDWETKAQVVVLVPLLASVAVASVALTELSWTRHGGPRRSASLHRRPAPIPSGLRIALAAGAVLVTVLALGCGATGDGTRFVRHYAGATGAAEGYPGWSVTLPTLLGCLSLGVLAWWTARCVEARPVRPDLDPADDAELRRVSLERALRPTAAAWLASAALLAGPAGWAIGAATQRLRMVSELAPRSPGDWVQWLGFALVGLCLVLVVAAVTVSMRRAADIGATGAPLSEIERRALAASRRAHTSAAPR
ncbi:MAG: hypothetical protein LWW86_01555 [Micrococcales bacterium]|nr:hypothetical protein [Micrococcales bacterium]